MKKSFTLLEMLIVLGIIATILSVLSVSFSTAQKKSRDSKRKGDLKAVQNGLEQYYSICSYSYPASLGTSLNCGGTPVISVVPVDPKTTTPYPYTPTGTSGFGICATLESETPANFCLQNQQ